MATQVPPLRGTAFYFETSLVSQADTNVFQTSVTLAAGDVTVFQDGVLDGNIDTLPTEVGTTGVLLVTLSAAEMTADRITVRFHDQVGAEWQDQLIEIMTVTTVQMDGIPAEVGGYVVEGTLTLEQAVRIALSALAGKASGGGTDTISFRDVADSKPRITATVDNSGNRTAITLDGT